MAGFDAFINPDFLGGSMVVMLVIYIIAFGLQLFMMYLNWKQSRVNNQMVELIGEVKGIRTELEALRKENAELKSKQKKR